MAQVIGLGGVFFKCKDPEKMRNWYRDVLGMTPNAYGILFKFNVSNVKPGYCQLGTFEEKTDYFGESSQQFMLNFRVDNLIELEQKLRDNQVKILNEISTYDYGKFLHIIDPEGNRVELWEPIDNEFDQEESTLMR